MNYSLTLHTAKVFHLERFAIHDIVFRFEINVILLYVCYIVHYLSFTERKPDRLYGMIAPWIGTGLVVANGDKWFRSRRLLTPAFHFGVLKPYMQVYNECAQTLIVSLLSKCLSVCIYVINVLLRCLPLG